MSHESWAKPRAGQSRDIIRRELDTCISPDVSHPYQDKATLAEKFLGCINPCQTLSSEWRAERDPGSQTGHRRKIPGGKAEFSAETTNLFLVEAGLGERAANSEFSEGTAPGTMVGRVTQLAPLHEVRHPQLPRFGEPQEEKVALTVVAAVGRVIPDLGYGQGVDMQDYLLDTSPAAEINGAEALLLWQERGDEGDGHGPRAENPGGYVE